MIQYLDLLKNVFDDGIIKNDRTGVGTKSLFGWQMRFNLSKGFPLLTTKKLHINSIVHELLWFVKGDTNIKYLNDNGVKINITAVFSVNQTLKILKKINKKTKVIISIFAGRAGDTGKDPIPEFIKSIKLAKKFKNVEILWASVREPYNYIQAKQLGCHIITIPPNVIEKIEKFGKSFNQLTIETVKAFLVDSKKSNFKI